jgi:hypothetical protein
MFQKFEVDREFLEFISGQTHGVVMRVSRDLAAKFHYPTTRKDYSIDYGRETGVREYSVARSLYKQGVSVVKPHGVFQFELVDLEALAPANPDCICTGFVMDYFHEQELTRREEARRRNLAEIELRKARALGWHIPSDGVANSFYDREQDRIYLFDFTIWEFMPDTIKREGRILRELREGIVRKQ